MVKNPFTVDPQEMIKTLLALAAEGGRKPRLTVRERERRRKRNRLKRKAARQAAWKRVEARRPKGEWRRAAFGERIVDRMVAGMESGRWYGAKDLARLAGLGDVRSASGKILQVMMPAGLLERRLNPAWDEDHRPTVQAMRAGVVKEPQWLYRLTRKGELEREALALMGRNEKPGRLWPGLVFSAWAGLLFVFDPIPRPCAAHLFR